MLGYLLYDRLSDNQDVPRGVLRAFLRGRENRGSKSICEYTGGVDPLLYTWCLCTRSSACVPSPLVPRPRLPMEGWRSRSKAFGERCSLVFVYSRSALFFVERGPALPRPEAKSGVAVEWNHCYQGSLLAGLDINECL